MFSFFFFPFLFSLINYPGFELCISTYAQLPVHLVWYLSKYDASFHVGMTLKVCKVYGLDTVPAWPVR